jgi:hypothetical protein
MMLTMFNTYLPVVASGLGFTNESTLRTTIIIKTPMITPRTRLLLSVTVPPRLNTEAMASGSDDDDDGEGVSCPSP